MDTWFGAIKNSTEGEHRIVSIAGSVLEVVMCIVCDDVISVDIDLTDVNDSS